MYAFARQQYDYLYDFISTTNISKFQTILRLGRTNFWGGYRTIHAIIEQ